MEMVSRVFCFSVLCFLPFSASYVQAAGTPSGGHRVTVSLSSPSFGLFSGGNNIFPAGSEIRAIATCSCGPGVLTPHNLSWDPGVSAFLPIIDESTKADGVIKAKGTPGPSSVSYVVSATCGTATDSAYFTIRSSTRYSPYDPNPDHPDKELMSISYSSPALQSPGTEYRISPNSRVTVRIDGKDNDSFVLSGPSPIVWSTYRGNGPYEISFVVSGKNSSGNDLASFSAGSDISRVTVNSIKSGNKYLYLRRYESGKTFTLTARLADLESIPPLPNIDSPKDDGVSRSWVFRLDNVAPTSLARVSPSASNLSKMVGCWNRVTQQWTLDPNVTPHNHEYEGLPGVDNTPKLYYTGVAMDEFFGPTQSIGLIGPEDVLQVWREYYSDQYYNLPGLIDSLFTGSNSCGTFFFNANNRVYDSLSGYYPVWSYFTPTAVNRAGGITLRLPQEFKIGASTIATTTIDYKTVVVADDIQFWINVTGIPAR